MKIAPIDHVFYFSYAVIVVADLHRYISFLSLHRAHRLDGVAQHMRLSPRGK